MVGAGGGVAGAGDDGGEGGVEVGDDDGGGVQGVGVLEGVVVGGFLFVDAEDEGLVGGVAGFDEVSGAGGGVWWGGGGVGDDEGVSAGAEAAGECGDVDEEGVSWLGGADEVGVGDGFGGGGVSGEWGVEFDGVFCGAGPGMGGRHDSRVAPGDHVDTVPPASVGSDV